MHNIPIGIDAKGLRIEIDSMGAIEVPTDRCLGAQTQRSLHHFSVGDDLMPAALSPLIGYDKAAEIASIAMDQDLTLREASGAVGEDDFDRVVDPRSLVGTDAAES